MKTKLYMVKTASHEGYDKRELEDYEIEKIPSDVKVAFYWYGTGDYCGSGNMIALRNDKWYCLYLGHCSCYGALDEQDWSIPYDTLDEMESRITDAKDKEIHELLVSAKKWLEKQG